MGIIKVVLSFFLRGVTSVLETEPVRLEEFDRHGCPMIELTAAVWDWSLSSTVFWKPRKCNLGLQRGASTPRCTQEGVTYAYDD